MAVQPQRTALEGAVELECSLPDVGLASMLLRDVRQDEDALTLLDKTGGAAEGTAGQRRGIGDDGLCRLLRRGCRGLLCPAALDPCRGVDR